MNRSTHRFLRLLALLPVTVLLAASLYMVGMHWLEDDPRDFWRALEFASETITTTGYGADSDWKHPAMVLFVIGLQFSGVVLIYMIVPMVLVPFLEERFESQVPRQAPKNLKNHVVLYRWGPAVETLITELIENKTSLLILEGDEAAARRLHQQKLPVLFDDSSGQGLESAHLETARALIANGSDEGNAAVVLEARQLGFTGDCLVLVDEPHHRRPMMLAGATAVYTPRHVLGAALAARASRRIHPKVSGIQLLGHELEVDEVRVDPDSIAVDSTLAEAEVGARTGAIIIGRWSRGHLETQPSASWRLEARSILVAVGTPESLGRLHDLMGSRRGVNPNSSFLIAGYGEVGHKVAQLLRDADETVAVLDRKAGPEVDHVGDVLDPQLLETLNVSRSQGVILALDDDRATLFATVILRDLAPELPIIARVNTAENVERIHRAGADFALSISHVSGMILARRLLGEQAISVNTHLKVLKTAAPKLVGKRPLRLNIRKRTGCSLLAVARNDELITHLNVDFEIAKGDSLFICGPPEATHRFGEIYGR
jgi:Trk K+ transport system NAD-binding subunit